MGSAIRNALRDAAASLLGISAYESRSASLTYTPSDADVERARRAFGGQLTPPAYARTRWYLSDVESAEQMADGGDLSVAAELMKAARKDGVLSGVLSTRTGGLVRLPKRFRGDPDVVGALEVGNDSIRSVFDEMFPPSELAPFAADGELLGVAVGELVDVEGRDHPVFVRLDPSFLVYRWHENRWFYRSIVGLLPITPGDGRWILHTPGGRSQPWTNGLWRAVGRAYIRKEHALLHKDNWEAKLANPARVAFAPNGSTEREKDTVFQKLMAWGVNTVFALTPGYEIKLIESNGRGYESFENTIEDCNNEFKICVAGQTVTTDGGAGFQNSDIHRSIRSDLIKSTADGLAYTLNTQGIPSYIVRRWGPDALLTKSAIVEWDVTPPKDRTADATGLVQVAQAIAQLTEALGPHERELDVAAMATRFGLPLKPEAAPDIAVEQKDPAAALNGAQVASLLEIVAAVAEGRMPRDSGIEAILVAFPIKREQAEAVMGEVGRTFFAPVENAATPAPANDPPLEQEAA